MKFGIFYTLQWHESKTQEQSLLDALEQIELADKLGIDGVWLGEHHFSRHGLLSGIWSFAGMVAARTKRIRIGTAVIVLPFHNPIVVAEEAAMLDILSGGRLDFGVGSGYQRQEFDGLGVDVEESRERFRESVDVIIKAWTEEPLMFHGKYTNVDNLSVIPKPLQKPHPPMYLAISTSPTSVEFAARKNISPILGGPTSVMGQAVDVLNLWRGKMDEFGHDHTIVDVPAAMNIYVTPTNEEAERDAAELADFSKKILLKIGSPGKDGKMPKGYESWVTRQKDRSKDSMFLPLQGTPERVAERIEAVRQAGVQHLFGEFGFPGSPQDKVLRAIEMFATEVMPQFREAPAKTPEPVQVSD